MRSVRGARWAALSVLVAAVVTVAAVGVSSGNAAPLPDVYVALGDSYASGVGTASSNLDARCDRSTYAYPALLAKQRADTTLRFVACSGATTDDVLATQVGALDESTTIVTISIGGNDLGFGDLISECVQGDCNALLRTTRDTTESTLTPRLDRVYDEIRSRAPNATVVVLGYPRLFSRSACFGTTGLTATERTNANLLSDEIDRVTAERAAAAGFTFASAVLPFNGHAICAGAAWVNGLNILRTGESFHPTRSGHRDGYAVMVRRIIG
jgi:lysophospholipase L1-like esterase